MTWVSWYQRSEENRKRTKERNAERYKANSDLCSKQNAARYQKHKVHYKRLRAAYYKEHKSEYRFRFAEFLQRHPGWMAARQTARRLKIRRATPSWADARRIERLYDAAALMSMATGVKYHVDHVIPLHGKNVCGLHVETNLEVIPASRNLEKWNSFEATDDGFV